MESEGRVPDEQRTKVRSGSREIGYRLARVIACVRHRRRDDDTGRVGGKLTGSQVDRSCHHERK